jgi:hypothetical protein
MKMLGDILFVLKIFGISALFFIMVVLIRKFVIEPIIKRIMKNKDYKNIQGIIMSIIQLIIYYLITKFILHIEFSENQAVVKFLIGVLIAILLMGTSLSILKCLKVYEFKKNLKPSLKVFSKLLIFFFLLALFEEIMVRGIIYGALRDRYSFIVTLVITVVVFVLPHFKNKGITYLSVISLLLAGVIMGAMREISGDIWLPLGFHFVWNFIQGFFGINVSGGNEIPSIYIAIPKRSKILNGGQFGIEASIVTIMVLFLGTLGLLLWIII